MGSDQVNAPWLDEALVEYLAFDFLRSYMGDDAANKIDDERYGQFRTTYERKLRLDSALSEFAGADYFYVVYAYGYEFYYQLVKEIGSGAFYEALKTYYYANYMGVGTKERLIAAFSKAAGSTLPIGLKRTYSRRRVRRIGDEKAYYRPAYSRYGIDSAPWLR